MIAVTLAISLACVAWLARFDPKRRRSFGMRPRTAPVPAWAVWVVLIAPGVGLALQGEAAGFVLWLSAVCVFGWCVVWVPPSAYRRVLRHVRARCCRV
ncbi:hypothetical protein [Tateyamaria omphalii]|uniref:DUF3325 domain-containing protein n=1 Tax=Tateyamaria omphalii TaxID=299262 RepID=A0A1P8N193_9RHOB|nr:hypothetical protein [Tateyamaria omphalii]APX14090.1 hypothetical protein BWR18_19695 [Tateyamaria omphalii]